MADDDERDEYTRQWDELWTPGGFVYGAARASVGRRPIDISGLHVTPGDPPADVVRGGEFIVTNVNPLWELKIAEALGDVADVQMPLSWDLTVEVKPEDVGQRLERDPFWLRPPHSWRKALRWIRDCFTYAWRAETDRLRDWTVIERLTLHGIQLVEHEEDDGSWIFR